MSEPTCLVDATVTVRLFDRSGQAALVEVEGKLPPKDAMVAALKAIAGYLRRFGNNRSGSRIRSD